MTRRKKRHSNDDISMMALPQCAKRARKSVYSLRKTKMADSRSLVLAYLCTYLCTLLNRGHSTVGLSKRCEGFMVIWLRAREEFADNRF